MGLLNFEWIGGQKRPAGAAPLLAVQHVAVRVGSRLVLDDVSLDVYEGEHVRITGPNGAGKSTLLNAIAGITPLISGRILFGGEDLRRVPLHERPKLGIRYMRQRDNVFPALTVQENLRLAAGPDAYDLFARQFPSWAADITPKRRAGMLSGGQKQKLAWAMATLGQSTLLLADEPDAGMERPVSRHASRSYSLITVEHS
jgi:branched-chain amino acid transport system ATP-binding protein